MRTVLLKKAFFLPASNTAKDSITQINLLLCKPKKVLPSVETNFKKPSLPECKP